jgi:hypothetical protein
MRSVARTPCSLSHAALKEEYEKAMPEIAIEVSDELSRSTRS